MPPPAAIPVPDGCESNDSKGFSENWLCSSKKEFRARRAQESTSLHNPAPGPRPLSPRPAPRYSITWPAPPGPTFHDEQARMTPEEIEAIVGGYHGDPFRILGPPPARKPGG